jgi:hypothetical protein
MKSYRFFYHYYKQKGKMSVHFRGKCSVVKDVQCFTSCNTKWNKIQPNLVMQGYATAVHIINDMAIIVNSNEQKPQAPEK